MHVVLQYWHPDLNPAITITCGLVGLAAANGISVRVYGEIEFWISILKVILMLGLFLYTFITMVGGNPLGDRYGFRLVHPPQYRLWLMGDSGKPQEYSLRTMRLVECEVSGPESLGVLSPW